MSDITTCPITVTREILRKNLAEAGIDGDYISRVIKEGLAAVKKDEPDHGARLKYLQLALELLDITRPREEEVDSFEQYRDEFRDLTEKQIDDEEKRALEGLRKFSQKPQAMRPGI